MRVYRKWVAFKGDIVRGSQRAIKDAEPKISSAELSVIVVLILALLALGAIVYTTRTKTRRDPLGFQFNSMQSRLTTFSIAALLLLSSLSLAYLALDYIKDQIKLNYSVALKTVRDTTNAALAVWAENLQLQLKVYSQDPSIVEALDQHAINANVSKFKLATLPRETALVTNEGTVHRSQLCNSHKIVFTPLPNIANLYSLQCCRETDFFSLRLKASNRTTNDP